MRQTLQKTVWPFFKILNIAIWSNNSTPRYTPKINENLYPHLSLYANVHSNIIYNTQIVKNQVSIKWSLDKQNISYSNNQILFGHKKEWSMICATKLMNLENNVQNKRSQSQKTIYCIIPFIRNVQNRQTWIDTTLTIVLGWKWEKWGWS